MAPPKGDAFDEWDEMFPFGPLDIRGENAEDKARKERKGTRPMADQTRYEELLQEFVKDKRNRQLLGSLEGLHKEATKEEGQYKLANTLRALSGSSQRLTVPERELPPEEKLTGKEELQLSVIKQGLVDLAKLRQELRGVDDPAALLKRRDALLTTLTGAAANIMSTTATSVAHADSARITAARVQYDSALRAYTDFEVFAERLQDRKAGDDDLDATRMVAQAAIKGYSAVSIADALSRAVSPAARTEADATIRANLEAQITGKQRGVGSAAKKRAQAELDDRMARAAAIEPGLRAGEAVAPAESFNWIEGARLDSFLKTMPNSVRVSWRNNVSGKTGVVIPKNMVEYEQALKDAAYATDVPAGVGGGAVVSITAEAKQKFAEDFTGPQAMLDSENSFLGELVDSVRTVGGETFGKDLDKLMTELSGLSEETDTYKKLDAILGMGALSADAERRLEEIPGKQEELIGKAPETKRRYTPEMMKDEIASRAIDFFNKKGGDLSDVPDPTRFLRHSFKARKQVLRGHDVNLPLASGKKFEGALPTQQQAEAAANARRREEEDREKAAPNE